MGIEALLKSACELSYDIAREGAEAEPSLDVPRPMQSFLYVAELPDRALSVAKQAIEDDPAFRRRVAEQATEDEVGRGGYLWLHRPIGWSAEFEELVTASDQHDVSEDDGLVQSTAHEDADDEVVVGVVETVPAIGENSIGERATGDGNRQSPFSSQWGRQDDDRPPDASHEANAMEDELSSLRGLVDRLASERQAMASSVERVESEMESARQQPSVFDSDVYTLRSELDTAREELESARSERDTAVQQHSAALTRQLELENELDRAREVRAAIEAEHAESDAGIVELRETLLRTEGALSTIELERDELTVQVESLSAHNEELMTELARLNQERAATTRSVEAEREALKGEIDALTTRRDELTSALATTEGELSDSTTQLNLVTTQATEANSLVEVLTEEKIDLASRLADTEAMLDTTRAQLGALKVDNETMSTDLTTLRSQRDGLSSQVEELHGSLTEALDNLARVRSTSDDDREALREVRSERDQLKLKVSTLEQAETTMEAKVDSLTSERTTLQGRIEEVKAELVELERVNGELNGERETLTEQLKEASDDATELTAQRDGLDKDLEELRAQLATVEDTKDGLAQQVEQLTSENAAIQDQLVESDRLRVETSESQGHALSELAHRLSLVETERTKLQDRLEQAQTEVTEAKAALTTAQEAAATAEADAAVARSEAETAKADVERAASTSPDTLVSALPGPKGKAGKGDDTPLGDERVEGAGDTAGSDGDSDGDDATAEAAAEVDATDDAPEVDGAAEPGDAPEPDETAAETDESVTEAEAPSVDDTVEPDESLAAAADTGPAEAVEGGAGLLLEADPVDVQAEFEETIKGGAAAAEGADLEIPPPDGAPESSFLKALQLDSEAEGDESVDDDDGATKRHSWSLGPLLRGAARGRKDEDENGEVVEDDMPPPPPPPPPSGDDDFDSIAAAVAEAARGGDTTMPDPATTADIPSPVTAEVPAGADAVGDGPAPDGDNDLGLIGAQLADAMAKAEADDQPKPAGDAADDDLDAISDLISQTVSGFDTNGIAPAEVTAEAPDTAPAPAADGRDAPDAVEEEAWAALAGTAAGPDDASGRNGGAPPSMFNGTGEPAAFDDDPFGPDTVQADRVTVPPGLGPDGLTSRRQIIIPDELLEDEVELARHVVSSPDVVLLVDGDSVAKMGWPSLPVAQQRDALVSYLADLSASSGAAPDVVFDGRIGEEESLPASRAVRIRLSTPPTEPAAALDELVDAYPEQWPIAVVTDDDDLAASAVERGAVALNNGQLLDLFIAQ